MEHDYCAQRNDVLLRPLHRYDIEYLRQWRNRKDLNRFLRDIGYISQEQQEQWFEEYMYDKDIFFFVVDFKRQRTVGSLAIYDFEDNICQIGKAVIGEDDVRGHNLGKESFVLAMHIGMEYLNIKEFKLSVHEENKIAKSVYERVGFEKTGRHLFAGGGYELEMSISSSKVMEYSQQAEAVKLFKENGSVKKGDTYGRT